MTKNINELKQTTWFNTRITRDTRILLDKFKETHSIPIGPIMT